MRFLSLVPSETHNSGFLKFMISQNVAVVPARIKIPHCLKLFFICSHLLAHEKVAVAPTRIKISMFSTLCPHLLHSKSSKNLKHLHQSWTAYVFVLCALMHFRSKTTVIISLFGMPSFVVAFLLFIFLIFPMEILTFCSIHDFLISQEFHFCSSS